MRRKSWWILTALVPALTVAAMTTAPPNLGKALDAQQRLAAEHPRDTKVLNDLGNLLVLAGRTSEAEQVYLQAIKVDPARVSARFNLGLLLQQQGRNQDAFEQYKEILRIDPTYAWAHYQIGTLHDLWRRDSEALQAYARAFALDPQLAFPEVNPQVIDNRLLTEALLAAHKRPQTTTLAPKVYDDPGRIARLLVPPVAEDEEAAEGDEAAGETAPEAAGEAAPAAAEAPSPEPSEEGATGGEGSARVLTQGDLDPAAPSNQAAPLGAGARRGTTYRPSSTAGHLPQSVQERLERLRAQALQRQGAAQQPPPPTTVVPGTVGTPRTAPGQPQARDSQGRVQTPRMPTVTRPGTSSTGRLEIELIPVERPAAVDRPA